MSEPGWTTGTTLPEHGEEAQELNQARGLRVAPTGDDAREPGEDDNPADGLDADVPSVRQARAFRLNREARFGIAALLSFLILAAVLVVNKGRDRGKDDTESKEAAGKIPPLNVIAGAGTTSTDTPAGANTTPAASPTPVPRPTPVASAPVEPVSHPEVDTPPRPNPVPRPTTDAVQLTVARNDGPAPAPAPDTTKPQEAPATPAPEAPAPAPVETPVADKTKDPTPTLPPTPAETGPSNEPVAATGAGAGVPSDLLPAPAAAPAAPASGESSSGGGGTTPATSPVEMPLSTPAPAAAPEPAPAATPGPTAPGTTPAEASPAPGDAKSTQGDVKSTPGAAQATAQAPVETPTGAATPGPVQSVEGMPPAQGEPAPSNKLTPPAVDPGTPAPALTPASASADPPKPVEPSPSTELPAPVATPSETPPAAAVVPTPAPTGPSTTKTEAVPAANPLKASPHQGEVPNFAPAPATPTPSEPPPAAAEAPADKGNWVSLPTAGKVRLALDDDRRSPEPAVVRPEPEPEPAAARPGRSAGPRPDAAAGAEDRELDRVEALPHVVERGENFWTISQSYYGSGRYYKALWAANRKTVNAVDRLYVGQTIRIPPPESLDRSLIEPPRARTSATSSTGPNPGAAPIRRASRNPGEIEVALPTSDPFARRRERDGDAPDDLEPATGPATRARRTVYKVRPHETLRSIARDTLGDSRRAAEILELNADAVDDPNQLVTGQILELPDDARVGRRGR